MSVAPIESGYDDYFDPNAADPNWPGVQGLNMRSHHMVLPGSSTTFDIYEALGPDSNRSIDTTANPDPGSLQGSTYRGGDPGSFIVSESGRLSACEPQLSSSEHLIVIELHGAYGFPDGICRFPVTPEGPGPDFPSNTHAYPELVGFGEIVIPGYEKLETIGWQSFWPNTSGYDDSYCSIPFDQLEAMGDPHDGSGPIANLIWTKRWSLVCRLVVGGSLFNDDVIITDFGYSDNFGDPNSVTYKITMKRYRTTSITSVVTPDSNVDHFSDIPSLASSQATTAAAADPNSPNGDGTQTGSIIPTSPIVLSPTAYTDEASARAAQGSGTPHPPQAVTVLPLTDDRVVGGGGIFHIFDGNKGETLNMIAKRMSVTWDTSQKSLNPGLANTDPDSVNLPVGSTVNIAIASPQPVVNPFPQRSIINNDPGQLNFNLP